ncbi:carbohydrate-binding module family 13 protein [Hypoxylon sp. CO27-5]|nr:carbohydrate-binding module family 13 protein [Hypoxylon sp. CO27-5]
MSLVDSLDGAVVTFFNYGTGTCLDLTGGAKDNGTPITGSLFNNGDNQKWRLTRIEKNAVWPTWVIRNVQSETNIDLYNGGQDDGTRISGWHGAVEGNTNTHQLWRLVTADPSGRVFMIQNAGTGTYVNLLNGNSADGTEISGWAGSVEFEEPNQLWRILRY